eukprot:6754946-Ditylum_brightwellii.AAC.1
MGEIVKHDRAILIKEMLTLLDIVEDMAKGTIGHKERRKWILLGAFAVIAYAGSFRGPEVLLIDIHGLMKCQQEGRTGPEDLHHVVVVLLGRFKGETGEKYHLTTLTAKKKSGRQVRKWVDLLISLAKTERQIHGPAFAHTNGDILSYSEVDTLFLDIVTTVKEKIPGEVDSDTDLNDYGID